MIIYGTERVAFRLLQESYNFRNGTELWNGTVFRILQEYDNFRNGTAELSFRILPEYDNLQNGTERRNV